MDGFLPLNIIILPFVSRLPKTFLDHLTAHGMSALHHAADKNNVPMVKLLLKHGANINLESCGKHCSSRDTPLNKAATRGHLEVVKFLIEQQGIKWGTEKTGENCFFLSGRFALV